MSLWSKTKQFYKKEKSVLAASCLALSTALVGITAYQTTFPDFKKQRFAEAGTDIKKFSPNLEQIVMSPPTTEENPPQVYVSDKNGVIQKVTDDTEQHLAVGWKDDNTVLCRHSSNFFLHQINRKDSITDDSIKIQTRDKNIRSIISPDKKFTASSEIGMLTITGTNVEQHIAFPRCSVNHAFWSKDGSRLTYSLTPTLHESNKEALKMLDLYVQDPNAYRKKIVERFGIERIRGFPEMERYLKEMDIFLVEPGHPPKKIIERYGIDQVLGWHDDHSIIIQTDREAMWNHFLDDLAVYNLNDKTCRFISPFRNYLEKELKNKVLLLAPSMIFLLGLAYPVFKRRIDNRTPTVHKHKWINASVDAIVNHEYLTGLTIASIKGYQVADYLGLTHPDLQVKPRGYLVPISIGLYAGMTALFGCRFIQSIRRPRMKNFFYMCKIILQYYKNPANQEPYLITDELTSFNDESHFQLQGLAALVKQDFQRAFEYLEKSTKKSKEDPSILEHWLHNSMNRLKVDSRNEPIMIIIDQFRAAHYNEKDRFIDLGKRFIQSIPLKPEAILFQSLFHDAMSYKKEADQYMQEALREIIRDENLHKQRMGESRHVVYQLDGQEFLHNRFLFKVAPLEVSSREADNTERFALAFPDKSAKLVQLFPEKKVMVTELIKGKSLLEQLTTNPEALIHGATLLAELQTQFPKYQYEMYDPIIHARKRLVTPHSPFTNIKLTSALTTVLPYMNLLSHVPLFDAHVENFIFKDHCYVIDLETAHLLQSPVVDRANLRMLADVPKSVMDEAMHAHFEVYQKFYKCNERTFLLADAHADIYRGLMLMIAWNDPSRPSMKKFMQKAANRVLEGLKKIEDCFPDISSRHTNEYQLIAQETKKCLEKFE